VIRPMYLSRMLLQDLMNM